MGMTSTNIEIKASGLRQDGFCVFERDEAPLSQNEWSAVQNAVLGDPSRFIEVASGDTSEKTRVLVHRLLRDGAPPKPVDPQIADRLMAVIGSRKCMDLYEQILDKGPLMIRRAQAHILDTGGFIGRHVDSESSPHYLAAVVLLLERAHEGGAFVIYRDEKEPLELTDFSMLITDADLPHEVLPVVAGRRCTLAFWLAQAQ
ncbi:hypothetical protein RLEG3_03985 (plasmid) [Rhizobium leguminosarum bv. trifolii WSM1689]|nr:hypothetical protein RLEG3_03985 [Rhizobium leguminosarum bv. trifolii WSM1689]